LPAAFRVALSFVTLALGWGLAYVGFVLFQVHGLGFGSTTDVEFLLFWPVLFILVGWSLAVVPLVGRLEPDHWIFAPRSASLVGAVAGVAILAVLLAPFRLWAGAFPPFVAFAAGVGLVGWTGYTLAARSPRVARMAGRPGSAIGLYLAPVVAVLIVALAVWPLLERVAPAAAYRYGSSTARTRIARRILAGIRPGERLADLDRRLPGLFPPGPAGEAVRITGNLESACYSLDVADGVVTWIGFENPCPGLGARPGAQQGGAGSSP
jgi:signal transduction histidine kinase